MSFETKINEEKLIEASKMKNEITRDRRLAAHMFQIRIINIELGLLEGLDKRL
jgi:hypothetical protein